MRYWLGVAEATRPVPQRRVPSGAPKELFEKPPLEGRFLGSRSNQQTGGAALGTAVWVAISNFPDMASGCPLAANTKRGRPRLMPFGVKRTGSPIPDGPARHEPAFLTVLSPR